MWSVWGALVLLFAIVSLYMARLSRDEESQIFLGDSFEQEKSLQASIAARVNKVQPIKKAVLWLMVAMTVVMAGYYIVDVFNQFK
jgi:hypothetical protein